MATNLLTDCLAVTAGGFLSSAHCIGMCGGFAAAVGSSPAAFIPLLARQIVYNLGRVFTYGFLGAIAGSAGLFVARWTFAGVTPQQAFALLAGVLMIALGLATAGLLRLPSKWTAATSKVLCPMYAYFLGARGVGGYFLAGMANGFLPCGLVYAFLAMAAATGDGLRGSALMAAFGIGTMPAMLLVGCGARLTTPLIRRRVLRVAGALVVGLGTLTVYRGWPRAEPTCCHKPTGAVTPL